jgi:SHS2 domain-containing protein
MPQVGRFYFEELSHTADKAILAHGDSFEHMLESAAAGLFAQQVDLTTVPADRSWSVSAEAESAEDLLVAWLRELLLLSEKEGAVLSDFKITSCACWKLTAQVAGSRLTKKIKRAGAGVKAVTYHNLAIRHDQDWQGTVTFDV